MSTVPPLTGPPLYRYIPGVGKVSAAVNGPTGPTGAPGTASNTGATGATGILAMGNVLRVDSINGNNATASVGGNPYLTVEAAVTASSVATSSVPLTIWVLPGIYNLSAGITIPSHVCLRGMNIQTTTIQMTGVTANTTLLTMGTNTRVEDVTLRLTSSGHYTLKGIVFGSTTTANAKLRNTVLTLDNSGASNNGTSEVYAVECNGTGTLGPASFSFNSLKGSTLNVLSNGGGKKRGILVSGTNIVTTRDLNVYVAQPTSTASSGSYVGVETNDAANTGSIQLRSTTVGTVPPSAGHSYSASDILQTSPATISDPTYLASAGIQIGPGVDLVNKSAGAKGFSTYIYPTVVYFGLKGNVTSGPSGGWLWPGTQGVSAGVFPDTGYPPAYYRAQQSSILSGLSAALVLPAAGTGNASTVTLTVYRTRSADAPGDASSGALGTKTVSTVFTVTFTGQDIQKSFYNGSVDLEAGDRIHVYQTYTSVGTNGAHDLTVQLDMF